MLVFRSYELNVDLLRAKQLSNKMKTYVDMLAPSRRKKVLTQRDGPLTILKTRTHDPLSSGQINDDTAPVNKAFFTPSPCATSSASAVDDVTHLCALRAQRMAAPPKVITVPDTELLSLDFSA